MSRSTVKSTLPPASHRHPLRSRSATLYKMGLIIAAVAGTAALSTGCAAGGGAASLQVQPNFAAGSSGDFQAQDMVVVVDPNTGAAQVTGTVVNNGDQPTTLSGVTVNGKSVPVSGGSLDLAPHSALNLAAPNGPKMVLNNSGSTPGHNSPVALTFGSGATISVAASTESNTGIYQQFQPSSAS